MDGRLIQTVHFTDREGGQFEAAYEMTGTAGAWPIDRAHIRKADLGA